MSHAYIDGKFIEIDESKVYKLNYSDFSHLMMYCNAAGRMSQTLYYKYADPYFSDECYDAFCKLYSDLKKKYPEMLHGADFTEEVGH